MVPGPVRRAGSCSGVGYGSRAGGRGVWVGARQGGRHAEAPHAFSPQPPSGAMLSRLRLGSRQPWCPDAVCCPRPPGSAVTAHTRGFGFRPAPGILNNEFISSGFWRPRVRSQGVAGLVPPVATGSAPGLSPQFGGSRLPPVVTRHTACMVPVSTCPLCIRTPVLWDLGHSTPV